MNKLYRYILVGILALIPCFSHAGLDLVDEYTLDQHYNGYTFNKSGDLICVTLNSCNNYGTLTFMVAVADQNGGQDTSNAVTISFANTSNLSTLPKGLGYCTNTSWIKLYNGYDNETCNVTFSTYSSSTMTSLQCQTNYNLIPIEDVTENYCKLNFDLINPTDCPINSGTGAVNWSSLFINGTQYPGNANISVYIPEYIARSITYNDNENIVDIEGYNADTNYIENVINNEKLTPTNEDFTLLLQGLVNFIPYLFIGLLILRAVKIFNRIWK